MKIDRLNPDGLVKMPIYTQAVRVTDASLIYAAGQVAWDENGNVIGVGDLGIQTRQAAQNITKILESVDADWSNVIKMTLFVAQYNAERDRPVLIAAMQDFLDMDHLPANTLIGVQSLAREELLIEIEVVIAVPA